MNDYFFEKICIMKDLFVSFMNKFLYQIFETLVFLLIFEILLLLSVMIYQYYIYDWIFIYDYKIYGVILLFIYLTNFVIHCILDYILFEPIYEEKYRHWIQTHNTYVYIILTLGIYNTYMLALYYRIHVYSRDFLVYHPHSFGEASEWWPIINIFTYIKIMRRLTKKYPELTWRFMWKLYFQGRLISYLVKNDYPYPKKE